MSCRGMNNLLTGVGKCLRFSYAKSIDISRNFSEKATIDNKEIVHHGKLSNLWWDKQGQLRPLHAFNPLRIQFVRDGLKNVGWEELNPSKPLEGLKILDVGCGGGILSEPLARIGANVTGIDGSEELINTAKEHASLDPALTDRLKYICTSIEDHTLENSNYYDAVVASEVLEHVTNKDFFIKCCVDVLKVNGSIFITTINKNLVSWLGSIILAEHVLKLIPVGTHEWEKFISPLDTQRLLEKHGCQLKLEHGIYYNPLVNDWSWTSTTVNNYALHAVKISST
ncbi:ubiquinone biosynthesis O-methyltransferase, mitochondrial [Chelonus insularis]|uniref:ubiquinone biosynthesis O-methyltransferase, mitochondrial n=1 Tax=Chelonus insularis TaxID=460826 RepID=UPI00158C1E72|nr:ubiquinone biosynthesis O-methyltransferase, mitochondrial [Chelonus insularis]